MSRRLHVGGEVRVAGWEVFNVQPGAHVDHLGDARDLSRFPDACFLEIYASHVLEHLDYRADLLPTLVEWRRVLTPGGCLKISVPDLDVLAGMLLDRGRLDAQERFQVMRILFGGHVDESDYHKAGLNQEILVHYLGNAGFARAHRVDDFGLFDDTSRYRYKDVPISLNLLAYSA